jgi:hypothetical protein
VIDWPRLIGALRRARYCGPFVYESGRDRTGLPITRAALEANYRRLIEPLLDEE